MVWQQASPRQAHLLHEAVQLPRHALEGCAGDGGEGRVLRQDRGDRLRAPVRRGGAGQRGPDRPDGRAGSRGAGAARGGQAQVPGRATAVSSRPALRAARLVQLACVPSQAWRSAALQQGGRHLEELERCSMQSAQPSVKAAVRSPHRGLPCSHAKRTTLWVSSPACSVQHWVTWLATLRSAAGSRLCGPGGLAPADTQALVQDRQCRSDCCSDWRAPAGWAAPRTLHSRCWPDGGRVAEQASRPSGLQVLTRAATAWWPQAALGRRARSGRL